MIRRLFVCPRTWRRAAFSLVEILIVLAIVSILAGFLFSVISNSREAMKRSTCASNLKQIGLANLLYTQDNNGFLPNVVVTYLGQSSQCAWADKILPYVGKTQIFECPSHAYNEYVPGCPPDAVTSDGNYLFDGSYDLTDLGTPTRLFTLQSRLQHPSTTISALDNLGSVIQPGFNIPFTTQVLTSQIVAPRHRSTYNVLFADGHVKARTLEDLTVRSLWLASENP